MTAPSDQEFLTAHRRAWDRKRSLRDAYARYHALILDRCPDGARVLELGCGLGHLGEAAAARGLSWVATDVLGVAAARVRCDAMRLPFEGGAFDRVVFVDVLHHLAAPLEFLAEARRVLGPSGSVVAVEPWVTPFSYPTWRFLHHEGCDLSRDPARPFGRAGKRAYQGDNGVSSLVCRKVGAAQWARLGLGPPQVAPFNDFGYLATRGFRPGPDAPRPLFRLARAADRALAAAAPYLAMRALVSWRAAPMEHP